MAGSHQRAEFLPPRPLAAGHNPATGVAIPRAKCGGIQREALGMRNGLHPFPSECRFHAPRCEWLEGRLRRVRNGCEQTLVLKNPLPIPTRNANLAGLKG